ncbi:histone H1, partial [Striga asiatica]
RRWRHPHDLGDCVAWLDDDSLNDTQSTHNALNPPTASCPDRACSEVAHRCPHTPSMIKDAIVTLKDQTVSSQPAIAKFIEDKQKNLPANFRKVLLLQLKKLVANDKLVKVKSSFKLPAAKKNKKFVSVSALKAVGAKEKKAAVSKPKPKAKPKAKPAAKANAVTKRKAPESKKAEKKQLAKVANTSTKSTPIRPAQSRSDNVVPQPNNQVRRMFNVRELWDMEEMLAPIYPFERECSPICIATLQQQTWNLFGVCEVSGRESNRFGWTWVWKRHFNFEARRPDAGPNDEPLLLFAELTTLSLVGPTDGEYGCQHCLSYINHPRCGFHSEWIAILSYSAEAAAKLAEFALQDILRNKAVEGNGFTGTGVLMDFTEKRKHWVHLNFEARVCPKEEVLFFTELYLEDGSDDKYVLTLSPAEATWMQKEKVDIDRSWMSLLPE